MDAEPAQTLVQASALSAGCLVLSRAQRLGHVTTDSGIVVSLIPLPVLSTGSPTIGLSVQKD